MELVRNSVWRFIESDLAENNLYRIIEVMEEIDVLIIFSLAENSKNYRPLAIPLNAFTEQVKLKIITKSAYSLPSYLLIDENLVPENHKYIRDKNYDLIKEIVIDKKFIFDYSTKKRVPQLAEHAKSLNVDRKGLARLLSQYWRFGQNKMALLPAFAKSGGFGKAKTATDKALGAPKNTRILNVERASKYIITERDKRYFKKALKKYYLKEMGTTLSKAYKNMLKDSYAKEVETAKKLKKAPSIPSLKQFSYWSNKLFDKNQIVKVRTSKSDFLRNKRGLLGSSSSQTSLVGSHFEIDATVADVHIVSEFGSQYILGRPTIYLVVDRASRMIVGMHVSLYHASWRAARQALANSFMPKVEFCKYFGIDIEESDWPCAHIPKKLVCDNGEMIGIKPQETLSTMTQLSFTPPYRPDFKGVVEKRFDILNKDVLHELSGTTLGKVKKRGSKDPRKDAIFTLKEVTTEIINAVLEHNNTIFDNLAYASPHLIEHNLSPTPLNYWKIHLLKHKHELQFADSDEVIAKLLPPAKVSVTRDGIHFNGMYYSCSEIEERNLASIARSSHRWQLEARVDENTTNYLYVQLDKNKGFIKCDLLKPNGILNDKPMVESDVVFDYLTIQKELNPITSASIDKHKDRQKVTKKAKERAKNAKNIPFKEKTQNVRQHRQDELSATTNMITEKSAEPHTETIESISSESKVIPLPKGRKRRKN